VTATNVELDSVGPASGAGGRETISSIKGAEIVVRHLEAQGVRHVFGVPEHPDELILTHPHANG
jgi:beta-lactamase superfamily II metal-dependent hydrolase